MKRTFDISSRQLETCSRSVEIKAIKGDKAMDVNAEPVGEDSTDALGGQGAIGGEVGQDGGVMTSAEFDSDVYNMNHKRRGVAIIINNRKFHSSTGMGERTGSDKDAENLSKVLREMGFEVEVKTDLPIADMKSALLEVAKKNHSDADCFACALLSHGEEGYVYGIDKPIEIVELVAPFKGNRCKTLAGKPKLFFIQACRGSNLDEGVDVPDALVITPEDMDIEPETRRIPIEADFLMAYSVVPGYYSWRNSAQGSWFIQALVEVLREKWPHMELLTMMTRVCRKVAFDFESNTTREFMKSKKQIPCITSMLTRDVYFAPKK